MECIWRGVAPCSWYGCGVAFCVASLLRFSFPVLVMLMLMLACVWCGLWGAVLCCLGE